MIFGILPVRPRPHATESGLGYVVRLMEANALPSSARARILLGSSGNLTDWRMRFPVHRLHELLAGHKQELERIAYVVTPADENQDRRRNSREDFKILGHPLGRACGEVHRMAAPALCPACVAEQGFIDAFYDLRDALACPIHRRFVVRTCPHCRKPLNWSRRGMLTCRCGGSFAGVEGAEAPEELLQLMAVIKRKLHEEPLDLAAPEAGYPIELLSNMRLVSLLKFLGKVGRMSREVQGLEAGTGIDVLMAAQDVLRQWPTRFHAFLKGVGVGEERTDTGGASCSLRKQFWKFLDPIMRLLEREPARELLRGEVVRFARLHGRAFQDRWGDARESRRYVALSRFAKIMGVLQQTVRQWVDDGLITASVHKVGRRTLTLIDTSSGADVRPTYESMTRQAASRELGIPEHTLKLLRERGVYEATPRKSLTEWAKGRWLVEDVRKFKERLLGCAVRQVPAGSAVSLGSMMARKKLLRAAKCEVVAAVLDGRIAVLKNQAPSVSEMLLDSLQVEQLCKTRIAQLPGGSYRIHTARRHLGLGVKSMKEAIRLGLIPVVSTAAGRVQIEVVERVNRDMVLLGILAKSLCVPQRELEVLCEELKIPQTRLAKDHRNRMQILVAREKEKEIVDALRIRQRQVERKEGRADRERRCMNALTVYLDDLHRSGQSLPQRYGAVSRSQVARACGFTNNAWHIYPRVRALLTRFDEDDQKRRGIKRAGPLARLRTYLLGLAERDEPLPVRSKGPPVPSMIGVANAAGFNPRLLCKNPEARALVQEYFAAWNARHPDPKGSVAVAGASHTHIRPTA